MSFEPRPRCKICGALHFAKDPHQFTGNIPEVKLESPRPPPSPKVISGAKFVANVPEHTKLITYGGQVIVAGPNLPASIVTDDGLVPIQPSADGKVIIDNPIVGAPKKKGRPATGFDRKAYQREAARQRRAKQKGKTP